MIVLDNLAVLPQGAAVYVYGAGRGGATVLTALNRARPDVRVLAVVDRAARGDIDGRPIIDPAAFMDKAAPDAAVIIASQHRFEIANSLTIHGYHHLFDAQPLIRRALDSERRPGWRDRLRAAALFALWTPVALAARLLRPIKLVRFGRMRSDRIGHWAAELEFYLCERATGAQPQGALDLFYYDDLIANGQLRRMSDRVIKTASWVRHLAAVSQRLPGGAAHTIRIISRDDYATRDMDGLFLQTPTGLSFTAEELARGQTEMQRMGVPPGARFVCVVVRDPAYLKTYLPGVDGSYHDYRNADIRSYEPAMRMLAERGYYVLRMGAAVARPLEIDHPLIIDYATTFRNEFMDMYLMAHCAFAISTATGLDFVSMVFRRPVLFTNFLPLEHAVFWAPYHLTIFKHFRRLSTGKPISWPEIRARGAGALTVNHEYPLRDIQVVDNTPDEITAAAAEMIRRLEGTWVDTPQDDELQAQFWGLLADSPLQGVWRGGRVGGDFLRANQRLLNAEPPPVNGNLLE